jgi:hypothetical protein
MLRQPAAAASIRGSCPSRTRPSPSWLALGRQVVDAVGADINARAAAKVRRDYDACIAKYNAEVELVNGARATRV